jgi:acylphosphatase
MAARRLVVRGRVQGVGFRYAMCREARRLALGGWVRNRGDGSVEAVAVGDAAQLDALQRWAQHGPSGARVDSVEADDVAQESLAVLQPAADAVFRQVETVGR